MPGPDEMNGNHAAEAALAGAQDAADQKTEELRALEEPAPRHAAAVVNGGQQPDQTAVQKAEAVVDAQIRQVVGVVIRGILVSGAGVPPDALCRSIARVTGALLADAVRADLRLMLQHRAGIKEAFKAGIDSTRVDPVPAQAPPKR